MIVIERMTRKPVTITEQTTVEQALEIMVERRLRHLPVLEQGKNLVGIVSEKDLLRAGDDVPVAEVMTPEVITITEYTALEEAARIMVGMRRSKP